MTTSPQAEKTQDELIAEGHAFMQTLRATAPCTCRGYDAADPCGHGDTSEGCPRHDARACAEWWAEQADATADLKRRREDFISQYPESDHARTLRRYVEATTAAGDAPTVL